MIALVILSHLQTKCIIIIDLFQDVRLVDSSIVRTFATINGAGALNATQLLPDDSFSRTFRFSVFADSVSGIFRRFDTCDLTCEMLIYREPEFTDHKHA